jgi:DHA1 family bicyclomycin/chloramphenicol resistance-like MFS transporter
MHLPRTLALAALLAASFFGYFALITGSPFALIAQLHVASTQFAFAFAINASSFVIGSVLSARLARAIDPEWIIAIGVAFTVIAAVSAYGIDTYAPSVGGFVATWTLYALGIAFVFPAAFAAVLSSAHGDAGLAAGLLGAAQMLAGAFGSALIGLLPGAPTSQLGVLALIGGVVAAGAYAASKPALRQHRKLTEARADDR